MRKEQGSIEGTKKKISRVLIGMCNRLTKDCERLKNDAVVKASCSGVFIIPLDMMYVACI